MSRHFKIRTVFKYLAWIVLLLLLSIITIAWIASGTLMHPERRALQDYQLGWVRNPASLGMTVHTARCSNGKVPCLFTAPDGLAGPKARGKALRRQLENMNIPLSTYGETQGILVLLHGRRGRKEDLLPIAERFAAAGFKCVIPDLPAHGDSLIDKANFAMVPIERGIAENVLKDARAYFGENQAPAGIWGISMGGAFALRAASNSPHIWKAVVIVASFDSLEGVVLDKLAFLPQPLPALLGTSLEWMLRVRGGFELKKVQPKDWANNVTSPVLVVHGDRDQVIKLKRGKRLFDSLHSKEKAWLVVRGANHRNVLVIPTPLNARMGEWFIAHVR